MLWLAGLMGLLAAGTVGVLELESAAKGNDDAADDPDDTNDDTADIGDTLNITGIIDDDPDAPMPPGIFVNPTGDEAPEDGAPDDEAPADPFGSTEGDDLMIGTDGADTLFGQEGDDVLDGLDGDDVLHGEDGNDILNGGDGADTLVGHNADDTLDGGAGDDALNGSSGNDVLDGGAGVDVVQGGLDDDTLSGGLGADSLFGGAGNDLVNGVEDDPDTAATDDMDGSDYLNGGGGDDTIIAGNADIVTAGDGADSIVLGDWIAEGGTATIMDFDAADDDIVMVYDDAGTPPDVTVQPDPDDPGLTQIMLDGVAVAQVAGGAALVPDDIVLMPLSVAQASGMAPA